MKRAWALGLSTMVMLAASGNAPELAVRALAQNAAPVNKANNAALNNAAINNAAMANGSLNGNAANGDFDLDAANNAAPSNNAANRANTAAARAGNAVPSNNAAARADNAATKGPSFNAAPVDPPPPANAIPMDMPPPEAGVSHPAGVTPAAATPEANSPPGGPTARAERLRSSVSDPDIVAYEEQAGAELRQKLKRDLENYCMDYCTILSIEVDADEVFETVNANLGFEETGTGPAGTRRFRVREARAEVLIDSRFGTENITRIQKLFERVTPRYEKPLVLVWSRVTFPETASTQKSEAEVRSEFAGQVRHQLERIIAQFCPTECKLNALDVQVARASMDEAERGAVQRYLFARDGRGALFVRGVQASLSMNSNMDGARRSQIASVMRESLLPFGSVTLDITNVAFPRPAEELQKDLDDHRRDPYGLEKIGALLKLFRENLVSKEVYKESNTRETSSSTQATTEAREKEKSSSATTRENEQTNTSEASSKEGIKDSSSTTGGPWMLAGIIGLVLLVLVALGALWMRSFLNGAAMKAVIAEGTSGRPMPRESSEAPQQRGEKSEARPETRLHARLEVHNLQEEILQIFVASPKASRDVFTRVLREDGIDKASKYVVIFGEIVVYELLKDLDLKDDLNTLAEYVHQNAPSVPDDERLELLRQLKLKLTAAKVKLLANRTLDVFDFLKAWSPRQIFELARDEVPNVQGIILTQLPTEKRRGVFELFNDEAKTKLLQALSQIDMMPREYLIGTAQFLKQKAQRNPMFDAENVRGTEVLMELLAKADATQQRALVAQLDASNPQAAWLVRNSLVTSETLLHVRDNILLDMFLDLDPMDMAVFLAGTEEHVRNGIFGRIPRDISSNWAENMTGLGKVDSETYRMAEAKIFSKVRQWASKGTLNLAEINEKVYPRGSRTATPGPEVARRPNVA